MIEYIWGAVGFSGGIITATLILLLASIIDDLRNERRR